MVMAAAEAAAMAVLVVMAPSPVLMEQVAAEVAMVPKAEKPAIPLAQVMDMLAVAAEVAMAVPVVGVAQSTPVTLLVEAAEAAMV